VVEGVWLGLSVVGVVVFIALIGGAAAGVFVVAVP
jgi:hypothetical protein